MRTDRTEPGRRRPDAADTDPIDGARAALREERARTRSERDAFEAFRSRVADVPAGSPRAGTPGRPGPTLSDRSADRRRAGGTAVREAYEATVMATPHYDEEYDEPYLENVAGEFGAELACALEAADEMTPLVKRRLRQAAERAVTRRDQFLDILADEMAALDAAEERLADVRDDLAAVGSRPFFECSGDELDRLEGDLRWLEADCEALADARQTELRDQRRTLDRAGDAPYLAAYLYGSLDVAYPVLASVATLVRRIRELRAAIETARASLATNR